MPLIIIVNFRKLLPDCCLNCLILFVCLFFSDIGCVDDFSKGREGIYVREKGEGKDERGGDRL